MEGIAQIRPGNTFGDIGAAIQRFAEAHRCSVVRDFCGHGLGRVFHSAPNVLHYGRWGSGPVLEPFMQGLADYITECRIERPAVVGHSIGGMIALMLAARHPQLPGRVVSVDGAPFIGPLMAPPVALRRLTL